MHILPASQPLSLSLAYALYCLHLSFLLSVRPGVVHVVPSSRSSVIPDALCVLLRPGNKWPTPGWSAVSWPMRVRVCVGVRLEEVGVRELGTGELVFGGFFWVIWFRLARMGGECRFLAVLDGLDCGKRGLNRVRKVCPSYLVSLVLMLLTFFLSSAYLLSRSS